MTPYFFIVGYFVGLVMTFVRPIYGLYTYLFTFYLAPSYMWWRNDVPDLRYLQIIGIATLIAVALLKPRDTNRAPWYHTGGGRLFLAFVVYNWLQVAWAVEPDLQIEGAILYTKHLISFYLFYRLADSAENIQKLAIAHVIGCAWFGYQALDAGGGRLEEIGGPVQGANELGVHVSTALLFGGILFLSLTGVRRWIVFSCLPLVMNCMILTISRGAFVGFVGGGLLGLLTVPRFLVPRYIVAGLLGAVLFSMLAHDELIERFTETWHALTTETVELDGSAASRTEIAKAGIRIGLDHPFGAGHRTTALLSPRYMPEEVLSRSTGQRAAHNSSAAVFAEHGFPGLVIYYLTIFWVLRTLFKMRRIEGSSELRDIGICGAFAGTAMVAVYISCNFSNNVDLETQYWCLALLASAHELYKSAMKKAEVPTPEAPAEPVGAGALPVTFARRMQ